MARRCSAASSARRVGHFLKTEQWSRIIPALQAGLHLEPAPGGLALRLRASF